jgi:hypothetical protein
MNNLYTSNVSLNSHVKYELSPILNNRSIFKKKSCNIYYDKYKSISSNNLLHIYFSILNNKKINTLIYIEYLYNNITLISISFFNNSNNNSQDKDKFKEKYSFLIVLIIMVN